MNRLIVEERNGQVCVALHRDGHLQPEAVGEPAPFESPLSAEEREDLRWYLEDYLQLPYAVYEERGEAVADRLKGWGERLFDALFGPDKPGRDIYQRAREITGPLSLAFASASPAFLGLPWELLRAPGEPAPLALDVAAFDRTLSVARRAEETQLDTVLRVLMVISRPYENDVHYQIVARPLLRCLEAVGGKVDLDVLRPPTLEAMKAKLAEAAVAGTPYHILHFDGHGTFGLSAGGEFNALQFRDGGPQGFLAFETEAGDDQLVSAQEFAVALTDGRVPVVVFNACRSGTVEGGDGPEAAVASRLIQAGAASVVAMSHSVYAVAAAEFMAAFYHALFQGKTVSEAVTAGRRRLFHAKNRPSPKGDLPLQDWMVPVHYARREVSFPYLKPEPLAGGSIDATLDRLRERLRGSGAVPDGRDPLAPEAGTFIGRDRAIQTLERALRLKRVAVVHGMGGTGKTELAKAFARWWQRSGGLDRDDLVFFHSFEPGLASFGLDGVVTDIGLALIGPEFIGQTSGPEERRALLLDVLCRNRLLLVWDNFETTHSMPDPAGVTPPLDEAERAAMRDFLAEIVRRGRSAVIITSRAAEGWLGDVFRLELGGLPVPEASEYADVLLAPYPAVKAKRGLRAYADLVELLDGHPLGLRLVLPHLATQSPAALVAALRGQGALPGDRSAGRLESLDACIDYSLAQLAPEQRACLPVLALFEGVADINVLVMASEMETAPDRMRGLSREGWAAILGAAAENGLLSRLGGAMYRLHPALPHRLVALWTLEAGAGAETEINAAEGALLDAYAVFGNWILQQFQSGSAEMATAVLSLQQRSMGRFVGTALRKERWEEAQQLLQPLDDYWERSGSVKEARGWADRCRTAVEDASGHIPDFESAAGSLWLFVAGTEAHRAYQRGDLAEAEAVHDQIRRRLEAASGDRPGRRLATAYHQLGIVAQAQGDLPAAESWYRRSLAITEALGDQPLMAVSYHQLGRVAQDRGDFPVAEGWYRKSLAIKEGLGDRFGMASSHHQLGIVAQLQGDLSAAEGWYRKSLVIEEALGNRPGMASSYHQLGMVAQDRDDFPAAEVWYSKSLAIKEALGDRLGMASSYHQLGIVAQARGDFPAAEGWCRKSLAIKEALGNRPGLALSYGQMGLLAEKQGNTATALDWMVRCTAQFDKFPHPLTGPAPFHLALFAARLGFAILEESWLRHTGKPLPEDVRSGVAAIIKELRKRGKLDPDG